jgi:hypothetical protein
VRGRRVVVRWQLRRNRRIFQDARK